jgi:rhodanese-related sulfurtransferase
VVFRNLFHKSAIVEVTPEETRAKQKAGAVLVDVREPHEWREGHIPGAIHIPLGSLSGRLDELDPSREIVVVCRSGHRSMTGAQLLQRAGFSQVRNMAGGMISWTRQQLPVSKQ